MKKLIAMAAVVTLAAGAFAEDNAEAPKEKTPAAQVAAAAKLRSPHGFDRAKFEERMKQRRLELMKKVTDILVAAGIPAEKAGATAEEIDGVYMRRPQRGPRLPHGKRLPRPPRKPDAQVAPPAEAAAPAAK